MSATARASTPLPFHVAAGDTADTLAAIADPTVTLSIWRRPAPVRLRGLGRFADIRFTAAVDDVAAQLLAAQRGQRPRWAETVAADAALLARHCADATGTQRVDLRLDRVAGNGCWRFHADWVSVRLITTYRGHGTQWLAQGAGEDQADELAPGDVGLFKGRLLAGDAAIVHRSPPIDGTGEERLLLVIDPARSALEVAG